MLLPLLLIPAAASNSGEIVIANQVVLRVRVAPPEMTVGERTLIVERRVVDIISYEKLSPPDVKVKGNPNWPAIYVGNHMLITVTPADAQANGTTQMDLANKWAENVRRQLPKAEPLGHRVPVTGRAPI